MREIKVRAWDGEETMWTMEQLLDGSQVNPGVLTDMFEGEWNDWIFMQYTGLKDKNGVEIYEGDIIQYREHIARVHGFRWSDEDTFGLCIETLRNPFYGAISQVSKQDRIDERYEVIGNIYENPELLK